MVDVKTAQYSHSQAPDALHWALTSTLAWDLDHHLEWRGWSVQAGGTAREDGTSSGTGKPGGLDERQHWDWDSSEGGASSGTG